MTGLLECIGAAKKALIKIICMDYGTVGIATARYDGLASGASGERIATIVGNGKLARWSMDG